MKRLEAVQLVAMSPAQRPLYVKFSILVIVLGMLFAVVEPANAVMTVQNNTTTAGYGCTGIRHRVQAGETIYSIAARYGSTAYRIASCNNLRSYTVRVGQSLLVPQSRRSASGWLEGIDFVRAGSAPSPVALDGARGP